MITRLIFMVATSSCINGVFAQGTNLDFHKDVELLLSKYCHQCHGPDTDKLFYFSGGTNAIYCYDLKTQERVCVEVPYQIIGGKKIWDYEDVVYTKGIFDSRGRAVRENTKSHGYLGYGWGHVNIAEPLRVNDTLYWLGGIGVIYVIDLTKPFSPDSVETVTLDPVGEAWTFGKLAYADGHMYARSQKDFFKLAIDVE